MSFFDATNKFTLVCLRESSTYHTDDLSCIRARHIAFQSLPFGNPAMLRIGKSDEAFKDLRSALVHIILRAGELKHIVTVRTAII